jgi:hypothetical protein
VEGPPNTFNPGGTSGQGNQGILTNVGQTSPGANLNLQQPYYQTMAYGPNIPPTGSGVPHGPVPDVMFPRTPAPATPNVRMDGEMMEGVRDQIAQTLQEFEFNPKGCTRSYQKSYPEFYDTIPYPRGFRVPDFSKFNGDDSRTTYEHIGQFLAQTNDVDITDVRRICLFLLSLSSTAFSWFTSLTLGSIETWPSLEHTFHEYFYNGEVELRLFDLTVVRQRYNEMVPEYLKRFRGIKNRCYNLTIGEKDLADLAFAGLASYLKEKMEGQEFLDMNQVLRKAMLHENLIKEHRSSDRFK